MIFLPGGEKIFAALQPAAPFFALMQNGVAEAQG
jgi:hypothetical protein